MKKLLTLLVILPLLTVAQTVIQVDTVGFTRPFNATAYTAGDVIRGDSATGGNYLSFGPAQTSLRQGWIRSVLVQIDSANATNANLSIKFFSDSVGSGYLLPADNAAYAPTVHGNRNYIGAAACTLAVSGSVSLGETHGLNIPFSLINRGSKLYAVLTAATSSYTIGQGKKIKVIVITERQN